MSLRTVIQRVFSVAICLSVWVIPHAAGADTYVGEVTGSSSEVHVRSGPSTNFYPVLRVAPGQRINVIGEESGWYAIEPLPGSFSLISKHYVDIGANGEGVVNGDAVRVRVGSDLDDHRYAVQMKLDKGAVVRVLGEEADGFLKIAPPPGARLWIHGEYVVRVPNDRLAGEQPPSTAVTQPATGLKSPAVSTPPAESVVVGEDVAERGEDMVEELVSPRFAAATSLEAAQTPVAGDGRTPDMVMVPVESEETEAAALTPGTMTRAANSTAASDTRLGNSKTPPGDSRVDDPLKRVTRLPVDDSGANEAYRAQLDDLDTRLQQEMARPVEERQLSDIGEGYARLVNQQEDRYVALYAQRRLSQVELGIATSDAIRDIRSLSNDVARQRRESLEERSQFRGPPPRLVLRGFDAKGELRESMIFSSAAGPRRYRLVDPEVAVPRTLCYVEIPAGLDIEINNFLGRLVGVRASKQYLETGDVDPIPVVVAEEIVILDRAAPDVGPLPGPVTLPQADAQPAAPAANTVSDAAAGGDAGRKVVSRNVVAAGDVDTRD